MAPYTLQSDREAEEYARKLRKRVRIAMATLLATVIIATIGFVLLGRESDGTMRERIVAGFWDTLNLVSTVGSLQEDFTKAQRLWAIGVIIFGLGAVLYGFGTIQALLTGDVFRVYVRKKMARTLESCSNHFVLCGYGRVGRVVAEDIRKHHREVVIIEQDPQRAEEAENDGYLVVNGDAAEAETLEAAGIDRAEGLLTTLNTDEANVFVTLLAREKRSDIRIVTRAEKPDTRHMLVRAGADRVIVPGVSAGVQLSNLMLKPRISEFIAAAIGEGELDLAELRVAEHEGLAGKTLAQLDLPHTAEAIVIAMVDADGTQLFNPPADRTLTAEDTLLVVCKEGALDRFEAIR